MVGARWNWLKFTLGKAILVPYLKIIAATEMMLSIWLSLSPDQGEMHKGKLQVKFISTPYSEDQKTTRRRKESTVNYFRGLNCRDSERERERERC